MRWAAQGCQPQLKMGLNKWEELVVTDMARAEELSSMERCDWWSVEIELHQV